MNAYQINKAVGLGIPLLILGFALTITNPNDPQLWWILIVITHTLAYMHFLLGYFYQFKMVRRSRNKTMMISLLGLTAVSLLFTLAFVLINATSLMAIIAIWYFILHGTLNEHTLIKQQFPNAPEAKYFLPFFLYLSPFFLLSLEHPSFFFTPRLEFLNPAPEVAINWLSNIVSLDFLWLSSLLFFGAFIVLVPLRLIYNRSYTAGFLILAITLATIVTFNDARPLNYIILYFIALSYHFLSFSFHFLQRYIKERPQLIPTYLFHHFLIIAPFLVVTLLINSGIPHIRELHWFLFDGKIFLFLAMVHNTTSLLNEEWFRTFVNKTEVKYFSIKNT